MRKLLIFLPLIFLGSCFSVDKPTLLDYVKNSKNVCPLAQAANYKIRDNDGALGEIKISSITKNGETLCYFSGANNLDSKLSINLEKFFTRNFHKVSNDTYMMYDAKISDENDLYYVKKSINGWLIYTNCKIDGKDCPKAVSTDDLDDYANKELLRQVPSYLLESGK